MSDGVPKTCNTDTDCDVKSFGCIKGHCCPKVRIPTVTQGKWNNMLRLNEIRNQKKIVCIKDMSPWPVTYNSCVIFIIIFCI